MARKWGKSTDTVEDIPAVESPTFVEPTAPEYPAYDTPVEHMESETTQDESTESPAEQPVEVTENTDENSKGSDTVEGAPATENTESATVTDNTATKAHRKRGPRPAIQVGEILVTPSSRTDFTTRATPMDNNPVYKAVKNAELDTPYDLHVDEDKVKGVISILRRSGARLGVGIHIASAPYPRSDQADNKIILTFKTGERQARPHKSADAVAEDAEAA